MTQTLHVGFTEQKVAPKFNKKVNGQTITQVPTACSTIQLERPALSSLAEPAFSTLGNHIIADLSGCDYNLLTSVSFIQETLEKAVVKAGATIISSRFHQFSPIGVSGIILLSESHCSIHTWPEEGYAAIDIYTCGEHVHPEVACEYIAKQLQSSNMHMSSLKRGMEAHTSKGLYQHNLQGTKEVELV